MTRIATNVKQSVRKFARRPGFTLLAVLTLAIATGATTAIFSGVNAVLIRALPYDAPDRLVALSINGEDRAVSAEVIDEVVSRTTSFSSVAGWSGWSYTLTGRGQARKIDAVRATTDFFKTLGASVNIGRTVDPAIDGQPGSDSVVVLSDAFWSREFGRDPSVLGSAINLSGDDRGRVFTVIGVMSPDFQFPDAKTEVWTHHPPDRANPEYAEGYFLRTIARVAPGVTLSKAEADLLTAARRYAETLPDDQRRSIGKETSLAPLRDVLIADSKPLFRILMGASLFVLLIGCVNVMTLLLVREEGRGRELAIREALGARRAAILGHRLVEASILAFGGGALGVGFAQLFIRGIPSLLPAGTFRLDQIEIDPTVLGFSIAICSVVTVSFAVASTVFAVRKVKGENLLASRQSGMTSRKSRRLFDALVVSEVALAFVLVVGASLMVMSFLRLTTQEIGFEREHVVAIPIQPATDGFGTAAQNLQLWSDLTAAVKAVPGVESVGAIHLTPLGGNNWNARLSIEGNEDFETEVDWRIVSTGLFSTLRTPVIAGRTFQASDDRDSVRVAIVNQRLAKMLAPDGDPIGMRVQTLFDRAWVEIVGVVADTKDQSLGGPTHPQLYRPHRQWPTPSLTMMVRTSVEPDSLFEPLTAAISSVSRDIPVPLIEPLDDVVTRSVRRERSLAAILVAFGAVALLLGAIGTFGVMAFTVDRRRREFGVRMSLGATRSSIGRLVLGDSATLALVGVVLGGALAFGVTRLVASLLYETAAVAPTVFGLTSVVLLITTSGAALGPAIGAASRTPSEVLREE